MRMSRLGGSISGQGALLTTMPSGAVAAKQPEGEPSITRKQNRTLLASLLGAIAVGVIAAVFHAYDTDAPKQVAALVVLVGGAAGLSGTVLGFLFGIPRTTADEADPTNKAAYRPNTSLEQISDWLTKILVGVGLTQISDIPGKLWQLAEALKEGYPDTATSFMLAVVLYSGSLGFLLGYVATRVHLAPLFRIADTQLVQKLEEAKQGVKKALDLQRSVMETSSRMMQQLYVEPPRGFEEAINLGEELADQRPLPPLDENFWLRLACAYAQRYKWQKEKELVQDAELTRQRAFAAMDKLIEADVHSAAHLMRMLSDANDPKKPPGEDDFEIFAGDPDFEARLRRAEEAIAKPGPT